MPSGGSGQHDGAERSCCRHDITQGQLRPLLVPLRSNGSLAPPAPDRSDIVASRYAWSLLTIEEVFLTLGVAVAEWVRLRPLPVPSSSSSSGGAWSGKSAGTEGFDGGCRTVFLTSGRLRQRFTSSCRVESMAFCCRKACVLHRAASCLSAGLFCNMAAVNSRSPADHCPGCSNVGGASRTIDMSNASIFLPLRGG